MESAVADGEGIAFNLVNSGDFGEGLLTGADEVVPVQASRGGFLVELQRSFGREIEALGVVMATLTAWPLTSSRTRTWRALRPSPSTAPGGGQDLRPPARPSPPPGPSAREIRERWTGELLSSQSPFRRAASRRPCGGVQWSLLPAWILAAHPGIELDLKLLGPLAMNCRQVASFGGICRHVIEFRPGPSGLDQLEITPQGGELIGPLALPLPEQGPIRRRGTARPVWQQVFTVHVPRGVNCPPGGRHQRRQDVREVYVDLRDLPAGNLRGPANQARNAESPFPEGPLLTAQRPVAIERELAP